MKQRSFLPLCLRPVFLSGLFLIGLISTTAFCQSTKIISITAKKQSLVLLLNDFQQQSQIRLAYANKLVDSLRVTARIADPPFEALKKLLQSTPLDFLQQRPDLWIIVPREQTQHLPGALIGKVLDHKTDQPVEGVSIFLHKTEIGATTGSSGTFAITSVAPGRYLLGVRRIGYANQDFIITVPGNSRRHISISLHVRAILMQELHIEKNRIIERPSTSIAMQSLSRREFAVSPLPDGNNGDLFELIHRLPGISRRDPDDVFPHIEGGSADETLVELDGMPINLATFGGNYRSIFAMSAIENLTIALSAFSAQQGDALSGVIALRSRDLSESDQKLETGFGDRGAMLSAGRTGERFGWQATWQGNALDDAYAWQGLRAQTFFGKTTYRAQNGSQFSLLALLGRNAFTQTNTLTVQQQTNYALGLRLELPGQNGNNSSLLAYRSGLPERFHETGLKFDTAPLVEKPVQVAFGFHLFHLQSRGAAQPDSLRFYKSTGFSFLDYPDFPENLFGQNVTMFSPYANLRYSTGRILAEVGVRLPTDLKAFHGQLAPRARLVLKPREHLRFSLAAGRYAQFATHNYAAEAKSGDAPDRGEYMVAAAGPQPSRADHFRTEISWNLQYDLVFAVAGFHKNYAFQNRSYLVRINKQFWLLPVERAQSSGIEFSSTKTFGRHRGWLNYTFNHVEYTSAGGTTFHPYFARDQFFTATLQHQLSPFFYLSWLYMEESGYSARNWLGDDGVLDPELSAEAFARTFFATSSKTGARSNFGISLRWFFAGPQKLHTLDFYLARSFENDVLLEHTDWRWSIFLYFVF